jgi:uncharacterized membrane protein
VGLDGVRVDRWTYGADTGTFAQVILDAFGGMRNGIEHGTHYRYHWSPALVLLWPFMALSRAAITLQVIQSAATVACAPLLYALAAPRAGPRLALRIALLALFYPPLLAVGWGEFHEVGLYAPLALGALVAADRRRWWAFAACVTIACGLREDVCLEFAIAGAALGIGGWRSRRAWFATAALALASLAVYYGVVIPRVGGNWVPAHFYVYDFAAGPAALALAPFLHPIAFARTFFTWGRFTYLLEAFAPLALLPLFSRWVLLAIPGLAIVLLANSGLVYHMGNHYAALWIPWLLAAAAFAAVARNALGWCNVALGLTAIVLVAFNPMHPAHFLARNYHDLADARRALACVPSDASVATHDEWFTAIAARHPRATLATIDGVDYLVYADDYPNAEFAARVLPALRAEVAAGTYREVCRFGAVVTYQRTERRQRSDRTFWNRTHGQRLRARGARTRRERRGVEPLARPGQGTRKLRRQSVRGRRPGGARRGAHSLDAVRRRVGRRRARTAGRRPRSRNAHHRSHHDRTDADGRTLCALA